MEVTQSVAREGVPKILDEFAVEVSDFGSGDWCIESNIVAAAQVDGDGHQRFFHREHHVTVSGDSAFVSQRLRERLPQTDTDIFRSVMGIDFCVAIAANVEIEKSMLGKQRQHMVEKADAGGNLAYSCSVDVKLERNLGFCSFA